MSGARQSQVEAVLGELVKEGKFDAEEYKGTKIYWKKYPEVEFMEPGTVPRYRLMDKTSYEVFEVAIPDYEEIGGTLESGDEVDYWRVLGTKLVRNKRSLD